MYKKDDKCWRCFKLTRSPYEEYENNEYDNKIFINNLSFYKILKIFKIKAESVLYLKGFDIIEIDS